MEIPSASSMANISMNTKHTRDIKEYTNIIPLEILSKSVNDDGAVKIDLLKNNLAKENTPPLYNQIFNEPIKHKNPMMMDNPNIEELTKGKFSAKEVQNLKKIYDDKSIEKSYDENGYVDKNKLKSILASEYFPPMQISSKENSKNLLNINV